MEFGISPWVQAFLRVFLIFLFVILCFVFLSVLKVKSVLSWGENSKNHFRLKSRVILERLVRKFRSVISEKLCKFGTVD